MRRAAGAVFSGARCSEHTTHPEFPPPRVRYTRGDPPCIYIPARGWFRAALKLPPRALDLDVLRKYHVAFHGTSLATVPRILRNGGLALPGTRVIGGDELSVVPGHITAQFWRTNPNITAEARRHTGTSSCTSCDGRACPAAGTGNELFCKNQVRARPEVGAMRRASTSPGCWCTGLRWNAPRLRRCSCPRVPSTRHTGKCTASGTRESVAFLGGRGATSIRYTLITRVHFRAMSTGCPLVVAAGELASCSSCG